MNIESNLVMRVLNVANDTEIISEGLYEDAERQLDELIRLSTIGKYAEQCFKEGAVFLVGDNDEVENISEFIGWCKQYID